MIFVWERLPEHWVYLKQAVSQHIQILRKSGFLKGEKRGYWTHYSVERSHLVQPVFHDYFLGLLVLLTTVYILMGQEKGLHQISSLPMQNKNFIHRR